MKKRGFSIIYSFRQALDYFNFPKAFMESLSGFPMDKITTLGTSTGEMFKLFTSERGAVIIFQNSSSV